MFLSKVTENFLTGIIRPEFSNKIVLGGGPFVRPFQGRVCVFSYLGVHFALWLKVEPRQGMVSGFRAIKMDEPPPICLTGNLLKIWNTGDVTVDPENLSRVDQMFRELRVSEPYISYAECIFGLSFRLRVSTSVQGDSVMTRWAMLCTAVVMTSLQGECTAILSIPGIIGSRLAARHNVIDESLFGLDCLMTTLRGRIQGMGLWCPCDLVAHQMEDAILMGQGKRDRPLEHNDDQADSFCFFSLNHKRIKTFEESLNAEKEEKNEQLDGDKAWGFAMECESDDSDIPSLITESDSEAEKDASKKSSEESVDDYLQQWNDFHDYQRDVREYDQVRMSVGLADYVHEEDSDW